MITQDQFQVFKNAVEKFIKPTDDEWQLLIPHLSEKRVNKNEYFIKEGKMASEIGFVLNGNLRHFYTKDGEEKTTYFYFENHFVASYISCITQQPSQLTIEALIDSNLIVFPYSVLLDLYKTAHVWERFGRLIAEYLAIGLEERMVSLLLLSPEERYRQLLNSNKEKIIQRIPQHYIANYLGITPVSLSRIRNRSMKN